MTAEKVRGGKVERLHLRLYTGTRNFEYKASLQQLHGMLETVESSYELEVLDGTEFRDLAMQDEALFTPVLVRVSPLPVVRLLMPQPNSHFLKRAILPTDAEP